MNDHVDVSIPLLDTGIVEFFVPDDIRGEGTFKELRSRAIILALLGMNVIVAGFVVLYLVLTPSAFWLWGAALLFIPYLFSLAWVYRLSNSIAVVGHGMSLGMVLAVIWFGAFTGGLYSPGTPWLLLLPLFATLFAGVKAGICWCLVGLVALGGLGIFGFEVFSDYQMLSAEFHRILKVGSTGGLLALVFLFFLLDRHLQRWLVREVETKSSELSTVLEAAPNGIITVDRDGTICGVNDAALQMFGYGDEELTDMPLTELIPTMGDDNKDTLPTSIGSVPLSESSDHYGLRADGEQFPLSLSMSTYSGRLHNRAVLVLRDDTHLQQMRAEMMQMDRVATVDTMASGLGHEINNPLAYIRGNLDYVHRQLSADDLQQLNVDDLLEAIEDGQHGLERIEGIVADLRRFTGNSDPDQVEPIDVEEVLKATTALVRNDIRHRARLNVDYEDVPPVLGNIKGLGQVFLNLLLNATEALPEGQADDNEIAVHTAIEDDKVVVSISDTGHGIADEHLERIFDPFFTTRGPDEGTGLGLAICQRIVEEMGGYIGVQSQRGVGTTFTVILPISPLTVGQRADSGSAGFATPQLSGGSILIVDDEPKVGQALQRALGTVFDVHYETSGADALELLEGDNDFDALLVDLQMPTISGRDFYKALEQNYPSMARRVVLITGGAFTPQSRRFLEQHDLPCVEKPVHPEKLFEVLEEQVVV